MCGCGVGVGVWVCGYVFWGWLIRPCMHPSFISHAPHSIPSLPPSLFSLFTLIPLPPSLPRSSFSPLSQVLKDGDVVRITTGEHGGKRAVVTRAAGVAGESPSSSLSIFLCVCVSLSLSVWGGG